MCNPYLEIVRWNGPVGSFTILAQINSSAVGVHNGDILSATISGTTITAFINGVQQLQVSDTTYSTGNPGIGFFVQGITGVDNQFGFTNYNATDGVGNPAGLQPSPPTALSVQ